MNELTSRVAKKHKQYFRWSILFEFITNISSGNLSRKFPFCDENETRVVWEKFTVEHWMFVKRLRVTVILRCNWNVFVAGRVQRSQTNALREYKDVIIKIVVSK